VPADALVVRDGPALVSALSGSTPRNIVLADGVYDTVGTFANISGHRVYAEHLGGAVLKAGIVYGGNWGDGGGLLQGVAFDVTDPGKTTNGSVVHVWGTGRNTTLRDITLDGNASVADGINVRQPSGLVVERVIARRFTEHGILVDMNDQAATVATAPILQDLDIRDVARPAAGSSGGTSEACLWIGNTATVSRVRVRNCGWEGVWIGTAANNALFQDIDVDSTGTGVGIWIEHFTRNTTLQHLRLGSSLSYGIACEWADPNWGSKPACTDITIQDSLFETHCVGVNLDEGTTRTTVRRSTFRNQRWAAIGNFRGNNNLNDTTDNDYTGILTTATPINTGHVPCALKYRRGAVRHGR
jgi:hypothetical protein